MVPIGCVSVVNLFLFGIHGAPGKRAGRPQALFSSMLCFSDVFWKVFPWFPMARWCKSAAACVQNKKLVAVMGTFLGAPGQGAGS